MFKWCVSKGVNKFNLIDTKLEKFINSDGNFRSASGPIGVKLPHTHGKSIVLKHSYMKRTKQRPAPRARKMHQVKSYKRPINVSLHNYDYYKGMEYSRKLYQAQSQVRKDINCTFTVAGSMSNAHTTALITRGVTQFRHIPIIRHHKLLRENCGIRLHENPSNIARKLKLQESIHKNEERLVKSRTCNEERATAIIDRIDRNNKVIKRLAKKCYYFRADEEIVVTPMILEANPFVANAFVDVPYN